MLDEKIDGVSFLRKRVTIGSAVRARRVADFFVPWARGPPLASLAANPCR
jgi:hypothetical protein